MNKKEQAAFEQLQKDLRTARAFRWTELVEPDVPAPAHDMPDTTGFHFIASTNTVQPCASSSISHRRGDAKMSRTGGNSQRPMALFSTRLHALQALRHEVEKECAARLAAIDLQIEKEQGEVQP